MSEFPNIAFIGGGNMARSLIGGLIERGWPRAALAVAEPQAALRAALAADFSIAAGEDNAIAARDARVLVLAVKPQVMREVCTALADSIAGRDVLVVSIAAGVRMAQIERWLGGNAAVVRCMPNTPALIGAGVTGMVSNIAANAVHRELAERLLAAVGATVWIEREELMDAVTATSGSGPAYFYLLMEALESAAIAQGLPAATARELVVQTCYGAARMAREGTEGPNALRQRVTSPGGTTQAAVEVLESGGFAGLVERATARATVRGRELAAALEG